MSAYNRVRMLAGHLALTAPAPAAGAAAAAGAGAGAVAPSPTAGAGRAGLLADHVSIITGSGQGIGEAAAKLFAAEGSKVVVTDIDAAKSDAVAAAINREFGAGTAVSVPGDVTDKSFPDKIVGATIKAFGKLNVLVNNAGYTWDAMAHKTSDEQFEAMLLVHNTAPFRLCRAAAPYLRDAAKAESDAGGKAQNRCVINVSSTSGIHGNVGQANYATAKAGINGLTKTLAKEWGPFGVRCNSIAFGFVETRLTAAKEAGAFQIVNGKRVALGIPGGGAKRDYSAIPLRRAATPAEAAGSVLAIASPLSAYITGHVLEVTGGAGI